MTVISKTSCKAFFETGDHPTQSNFGDLIDSYQDAAMNLGTLSSASLGAFGLNMLATNTTAAAKNTLGIGAFGDKIFQTATTAAGAELFRLSDGTYTPTLTFLNNIASASPLVTTYFRIGNTATVAGAIVSQPTSASIAGNFAQVGLTLPVSSNFTLSSELGGTGFSQAFNMGASIYGDVANDRATIAYYATTAATTAFQFSFTYIIK